MKKPLHGKQIWHREIHSVHKIPKFDHVWSNYYHLGHLINDGPFIRDYII
jgi:hypothetical protein